MSTSVALTTTWFLDGPTYNGQICRQDVAAMCYDTGTGGSVLPLGGVLQGGERMGVNAATGMQVTVNGGACIVPSGVSALQGAYRVILMQPATLTVATSDASNPRVDAVAVYVDDLGTNSSQTFVEVFAGTPTAGANLDNLNGAPTLPDSCLLLAYILVPAGSTSVTSGNIQDQRIITVAPGGVLPCASTSAIPSGTAPGQLAYDAVNDRFFHLAPGGPEQARTLPFAPQADSGPSDTSSVQWNGSGEGVTLASISVAVDGAADLEIHASWSGYSNANASGVYQGQFSVQINGTLLREVITENSLGASIQSGGGSLFHVTQGGLDRPGAGMYTVSLIYFDSLASSAHHTFVYDPILYVRPVPL